MFLAVICISSTSHINHFRRCIYLPKVCLVMNKASEGRSPLTVLSIIIARPGLKGALSRYFEVFWPSTNLPLNTKEIIINHKGTRMVKDGEDWQGLQTTKLRNLAKFSNPFIRDVAPLIYLRLSFSGGDRWKRILLTMPKQFYDSCYFSSSVFGSFKPKRFKNYALSYINILAWIDHMKPETLVWAKNVALISLRWKQIPFKNEIP